MRGAVGRHWAGSRETRLLLQPQGQYPSLHHHREIRLDAFSYNFVIFMCIILGFGLRIPCLGHSYNAYQLSVYLVKP